MKRKIRRYKHKLIHHKSVAAIFLGLIILMVGFLSHHITKTHSQQTKTITMTQETNLLSGQWSYLPGVQRSGAGLTVKPTNLTLVEQNGTPGQANPPVNVAGTYVASLSGDFGVKAQITVNGNNRAILQLYGRTPIIADEFRIERESIKLELDKGSLIVTSRNASGQASKYPKVFHFAPQNTINVVVKRLGTTIFFDINGKNVGSMQAGDIFSSKQIWFGLESKSGEWTLSLLSIVGINGGSFTIMDGSKFISKSNDLQGLQTLASKKRPGFIVGMARAVNPSFSDPEYQAIAYDKNIFGSLTPENAMKMANLQPQRGVYTYEQADAIVEAARQNGILVHGHTLVFGEANPPWLTSLPNETPLAKQQIETIMRDHITNVVGHYKGKVTSWDVINEPMAAYEDTEDTEGAVLRQHIWYKAMGEDYIIKALETAYRTDPNAMLFINEYGLEDDGDRWDAFVALMKRVKVQLKARGIPTEKIGVGFQAHVYEPYDRIKPLVFSRHLKQLEELGFKAQISEMDVYGDYNDSDRTEEQAREYAEVFKTCLSEKNCIAWRGWILSDRYNYFKDDDGSIYQGVDGLFDKNMKPRPAYTKIQEILK